MHVAIEDWKNGWFGISVGIDPLFVVTVIPRMVGYGAKRRASTHPTNSKWSRIYNLEY